MPYGFSIALSRFSSALGSKPKVLRSSVRLPLSRIRSTIFSPNSTGSVETRKSITRDPILSLMRPSCGTRRSAMLSCAMIFTLDVDVRGAALHRVREQAVDELDHGSVVGQVLRLDVFVLLILDNLEILGRLDRLEQRLQLRVRLLVVAVDGVAQRVFPGDDRKDVATGDELDVLDRRHVVGIGDGDREGSPLPFQGENRVLAGDVGGEESQDLRVDLEPR